MMSRSDLQEDMALCVRDLIGEGYIDDYYHQLASEFTQVAIAHGATEGDQDDN